MPDQGAPMDATKLARITLEVTVPERDAAEAYEALASTAVKLAKDGAPLGYLSVTVASEEVDGTIEPVGPTPVAVTG